MSRLHSHIAGIPCIISYAYTPGAPMRISGTGFGDCDPPEPPDIEFAVHDRRDRPAAWLEAKMTESDYERIELEIMKAEGDYCGP